MAQVMLHSKYLVIGGGGYLGYRLGLLLLKTGETVTLFDVKEPDDLNPKFQFIEANRRHSSSWTALTFYL